MLTENRTTGDGNTLATTYTYDKYGNLISEKETNNYNTENGPQTDVETTTYVWKLYYNPEFADEDFVAAYEYLIY